MKLSIEQSKQVREFAEELAPLYNLFNWHWKDKPNTPTAHDIEKNILDLMNGFNKPDYHQASSGGITVCKSDLNDVEITWSLDKTIYLT